MGYNRWRLYLKVLKWLLVLFLFLKTLAQFIPSILQPSVEDYIFTPLAYYASMFGSLVFALFFWFVEEIICDKKKHIFVKIEIIICLILIIASIILMIILKIHGNPNSNTEIHHSLLAHPFSVPHKSD